MTDKNPSFPEIKADILDRINKIEDYIMEGNRSRNELTGWMKKVHIKVYGDADAHPPIEGLEHRIIKIEVLESDRTKKREVLYRMAIASLTVVVSASILWVVNTLKYALLFKKDG